MPFNREDGLRVGNVVPQGFEAYARIFHPASRYSSDGREREIIRWSQIASWNSRVAHPAMQLHAILGQTNPSRVKIDWGQEPPDGCLDPAEAAVLSEMLAELTTTPQACFFCIWEGWAEISGGRAYAYLGSPSGFKKTTAADLSKIREQFAKRVTQPPGVAARLLDLFRTPFDVGKLTANDLGETARGLKKAKRISLGLHKYVLTTGAVTEMFVGSSTTPSFWWPEDRVWYVGTDIDMNSTFVGGTAECINRLVADPRLEALPIGIDVRIDTAGDTINV